MEKYMTNYMVWFVVALLFIGLIRTLFFNKPKKPIEKEGESDTMGEYEILLRSGMGVLAESIKLELMIEPLRRKSQPATIVAWFEKVGIFPVHFAGYYGIRNVSAVITTLKQRGYNIKAVKMYKKISHYELIK